MEKCNKKTEVYSRVCGFFRPVQQWNKGKQEEFRERVTYAVNEKETINASDSLKRDNYEEENGN